jgi:hypothetical protein
MNEHNCIHEKDFGTLFTKLDNLIEVVSAQTVVITDLIKFQASLKAVDNYKEKESLSARQRAGIYISGILGVSTIVTSVILKLL